MAKMSQTQYAVLKSINVEGMILSRMIYTTQRILEHKGWITKKETGWYITFEGLNALLNEGISQEMPDEMLNVLEKLKQILFPTEFLEEEEYYQNEREKYLN